MTPAIKLRCAALGASGALLFSSCDQASPRAHLPRNLNPSDESQAEGSSSRMTTATVSVLHGAMSTIDSISDAQQSNFNRSGEWLTRDMVSQYTLRLWRAVSLDVLRQPFTGGISEIGELSDKVYRAGFYVHVAEMVLRGKPYLHASLFSIVGSRECSELQEVATALAAQHIKPEIRELLLLASTPGNKPLLAAVSQDGCILIPSSILAADQSDFSSLSAWALRGELARYISLLKLQDARERGVLSINEPGLDQAYVDYSVILAVSAANSIEVACDVMARPAPLNADSRRIARQGLSGYGFKYVGGFRGLTDSSSENKLFAGFSRNASKEDGERLKFELLNAYEMTLIGRGFPSVLFY